MAKKRLPLVLSRQILSPLPSVIPFGLLLILVNVTGSFWWALAYGVCCVYVYAKFFKGRTNMLFLFSIFAFTALAAALHITVGWIGIIAMVFLAFLLHLLLGGATFLFSGYKTYVSVVYYFLLFFITAYFSGSAFSSGGGMVLILFVLYYVTLVDYMAFMLNRRDKRIKIFALVSSLVASQFAWVASLLSIGFLGAASLVLIFWIIWLDIMVRFFSGTLQKNTLYKDIIFFAVCSACALFLPLVL